MFGTRYRILRMLGAGGMGVVYQAWDQALEVAVALKVIRPEAVSDPDVALEVERRFKRELLLARQVTHRNVVRIHDFGEVDGIKYISMPFIEGRDLASILVEAGRLPLARAIDVIRQVANGLAAAHEAGIVHRDLKPENVMIDAEGRALIMDFGISRSVGTGATTSGLTVAGAIVGTLEYMPPEQARGSAVDHRADVYSLGLIFYDLLGGRRRIERTTSPVSEMMSRIAEPPPPLRTIAPDTPPEIERIVGHALEPDPAKRYQSVGELLADLDAYEHGPLPSSRRRSVPVWIVAVTLAVLIGAGAGAWWLTRSRAAPATVQHDPVSVLIADFQNTTGDPLFEGSVEQALGIGLEGTPFITAYPRRDAMRAVAQIGPDARLEESTARLVSQREGIAVVLAGAIAPASKGYRISVKAIDSIKGAELAAADVPVASKSDVLQAVGTLSARLRRALGDTTIEANRLTGKETFTAGSLEAAREYSVAQDLGNADRYEEAIEHYKRAVALDPNFGRAYSGWASIEGKLGRLDAAESLYQKAFTLLDRMTERERYRTQGAYFMQIKGDNEKGIENYSALVEKYPADGAGHNNLAVAYFGTRQFQKALEEGRTLLQIYPRSVLYTYNYALYAMYAGDFATAAREAQRALRLNPNTPKAYLALAVSALASGNLQEARASYQKASTAGPRGVSLASLGLADVAMYEGRFGDAAALLEKGIAGDRETKNEAGAAAKMVALAQSYAALGRTGDAIRTARDASTRSKAPRVLVPAAEILIEGKRASEARALAGQLQRELQPYERAAAKIIEGDLAVAAGEIANGITAYRAALRLDDLWIARYKLAIAYVQEGHSAAEASAELENCSRRHGEMAAVFLDDLPTWRYGAPLKYWTARAYDALGVKVRAVQFYKEFLDLRPSATDALSTDARARLAG
jgi:tetratricopeptide (TPR) repeat protein